MRKDKPLQSDIAWSTPDRITVLGFDLPGELMGTINFGDMAFLEITRRLPNPQESRLFNAMLVTLVEHGLVPSTLAARLTYAGAPEAMQGAVAAGLLGLGSVFVGSTEGAARMLSEALPQGRSDLSMEQLADAIVQRHRSERSIVPGIGHPLHKPVDPRAERLFALAAETGFSGPYVELMKTVAKVAERASGKQLPVNATGALGALVCELGMPWTIARGIGLMARSVGLVGHILEEGRQPLALEVWQRAEHELAEYNKALEGARKE